MKRIHVWFYGKVQGVFFRANVRERALQLGVNGWIKNLNDGSVEAVFEGEKVDSLLGFCKESFDVEDVKVEKKTGESLKT